MLAKKNRLTKKEFDYVYANGKKNHAKNFYIVWIENNDGFKVSVVAPTKKFKKAVLRNKKRRIIYSFFSSLNNDKKIFKNRNVSIIIFVKNNDEIKKKIIYNKILNILSNIDFVKK